jgi:ATP-dependent DNA helicase RecG
VARRPGEPDAPAVTRPPEATEPDFQDRPVDELRNVGPQVAAVLRNKGFATIGDVLAHTPRRYLDLRNADDWRLVRNGAWGSLVAVEARVEDARLAGPPNARRLMLALREPRGTTVLRAVFFHAKPGMAARMAVGTVMRVVGMLRDGVNGPELVQPKVVAPGTRTRPVEPVYGAIGSVPPGNVARIVAAAMERANEWADPVPPETARTVGLLSPLAALRLLHAPDASVTEDVLHKLAAGTSEAHRRLGFEELLALSAALERARRTSGGARRFPIDDTVVDAVEKRLSLTLTGAQRQAIAALLIDYAHETPSRRLLVGDVGSGKTAVALAASLAVLRAGGSVAWLCPTTLVAEQHARTLEKGLAGEGGPIAILLGSTSTKARKQAEKVIAHGLVRMVVGTHAILESGATPPGVGLVVIDEQHRFGVAQRLALVAGRSPSPHLLVLSATPIPRSLALARYGDLDVLTLAEKPAGRQEVATRVVPSEDRAYVVRTIERAVAAGGRVFVVVPRIDASEAADLGDDEEGATGPRTDIASADAWLAEAFGRERIVTVHGRMSADAQREGIEAFRRGTHPILLGTTVVEVGLDVPAANLMVVLGAEFFGVAQLHQLRGRVGRGGQRAGCLLVPEAPAGEATRRLDEVASCHDGYKLAEMDLARRGAGEWFGARQSGVDVTLRFADPTRDPALAAHARDAAQRIVHDDPTLARHPRLARAVRRLLARGAAPVGEEAG